MDYLLSQDPYSIKDAGGQAHRGRCSPLARFLQQKGLYTGGQKCALHGKGEMHRETPEGTRNAVNN